MKLSAVLAGCLVVVCCAKAVNTECITSLVIVFDCLDDTVADLWKNVKRFTTALVHLLPESSPGKSAVKVALVAKLGSTANGDLVTKLSDASATDKQEMIKKIAGVVEKTKDVKLVDNINLIKSGNVFEGEDDKKRSTVAIIKDGSQGSITADAGDALHTALKALPSKTGILLTRISDAKEDTNAGDLMTWLMSLSRASSDINATDSSALTEAKAYETITVLDCTPLGATDKPGTGTTTAKTGNNSAISLFYKPSHGPVPLCVLSLAAAVSAANIGLD